VRKGDATLSTHQAWITNGGVADAAIVYVNTDPAKGEKGITALVVERARPDSKPGGRKETWHPRYGVRGTCIHRLRSTGSNRIGNEGEGYKVALSTLDGDRPSASPRRRQASRKGAFEQALAYAPAAASLRHPIADFQAIQFMLADMATEIDAARLLVRKAAWKQARGALHRGGFDGEAVCFGNGHARHAQSDADSRGNGYSREYPSSACTATRGSRRFTRHERNPAAGDCGLGVEELLKPQWR